MKWWPKKKTSPEERLTQEEFDAARCSHCGGVHLRACPRVKAMKFERNGADLVEVEFWETFDDTYIVWPESVWEVPEEEIE